MSCKVVARSTVQTLSLDEMADPEVQVKIAQLDAAIREKIGDTIPDDEMDPDLRDLLPHVPEDLFLEEPEEDQEAYEPHAEMPEADEYTPKTYDEYLNAEFLLPHMGDITKVRVKARKRDADGNPIGHRNTNPILDTREYEVEFPDGATDTFTANLIAENLYLQVDTKGNLYSIFSEIVDHKSDGTAISSDDGMEVDKHGQTRPRRTTKGWKLLVAWKGGSATWVPLKDLK
jgi:hypothetical protein